jgi:hypothetical protein
MNEDPTTVIIQLYQDALPGDTAAEPIVRELLERAVGPTDHRHQQSPGDSRPDPD